MYRIRWLLTNWKYYNFYFYSRVFLLGFSSCQHYTFRWPISFYLYKHNHLYQVLWQKYWKKSGGGKTVCLKTIICCHSEKKKQMNKQTKPSLNLPMVLQYLDIRQLCIGIKTVVTFKSWNFLTLSPQKYPVGKVQFNVSHTLSSFCQ